MPRVSDTPRDPGERIRNRRARSLRAGMALARVWEPGALAGVIRLRPGRRDVLRRGRARRWGAEMPAVLQRTARPRGGGDWGPLEPLRDRFPL